MSILNDLSVPTRYPDDLEKMFKNYSKERTKELLEKCGEVLTWLKTTIAEYAKQGEIVYAA
ncbi:MAG: hypothetical protein QME90_00510 [Thermodesulfobacteriota bacterium]|nr:hypothetical protein [Thermodesulfobacteriota bacterium]